MKASRRKGASDTEVAREPLSLDGELAWYPLNRETNRKQHLATKHMRVSHKTFGKRKLIFGGVGAGCRYGRRSGDLGVLYGIGPGIVVEVDDAFIDYIF